MTLTDMRPHQTRRDFPVELLSPLEMSAVDRLAAETGTTGVALMAWAGAAVARAATRMVSAQHGEIRIVVLCGPGNNGGDGFVAARMLARHGFDVTVGLLGDKAALHGDAAHAAEAWTGAIVPLADLDLAAANLAIDALFGAGLARDLDGLAKDAVLRLNDWAKRTKRPVLAVDVPSGIDGASGLVRGVAVEATACVTFFRLKPGHILMPGRLHCGALELSDIGIDPWVLTTIEPRTRLNTPPVWADKLPVPTLSGHKYLRGHALVLSGPMARTGAARLAARGALRAGAGLVTVATPADALAIHATTLTAIMTHVCDSADDLEDILNDHRKNAVVLGPGLGVGEHTRGLVLVALSDMVLEDAMADDPPRGIVLDADALVSFATVPDTLFAAIKASPHAVVLTPHDGEFAKLFGSSLDMKASKLDRTRAAAVLSGATVVLKGPDTVVAATDGRASIAASEAPWLATAGSGDVLAGMIGGLLAQAMPPYDAASAAVWIHAEAARRFGPGLISEDIPEGLPAVLRQLFERSHSGQ